MSRTLLLVLALFAGMIVAVGLPDAALAQKRVAFVVGTDKYDNLDKTRQLQRAVNDARAVGAAFKALGFDVIAAENLTRGQFNSEWQKFLDKLAAGDTAAIYYAGHGVEIEGLNFLLPRDIPDIKFGRQEQIKRESLSVAEILLDLRGRNPEIALVILDACRDNPLIPDEMRSAGTRGGGLAPLKGEPPKGTFIMYSAGAGETALDRLPGNDPDRENSIFTRKLVPLLATKGLALHDMARQLRTEVIALASTVPHSQRPAYYDGVDGRYCLAGCEGTAETVKRETPSGSSARLSEAAEAWAATKDTTSIAVLEAFMMRYTDTIYADLAWARAEELRKQQALVEPPRPSKPAETPDVKSKPSGAEELKKQQALVEPPRPSKPAQTPDVKPALPSAGPDPAVIFAARVARDLMAAVRTQSPAAALADVFRRHGDLPHVGLYSLGSYRDRLPRAEQANYYEGMVRFVSRYVASEAPKYAVNRIEWSNSSLRESTGMTMVDAQFTLAAALPTTCAVCWHRREARSKSAT